LEVRVFRPLDTARQRRFYDDLSQGDERRGLWGLERRFSPESAAGSRSFEKYFTRVLAPILNPDMRVLDVGCGTGIYFPLVAPRVASMIGAELSSRYARLAHQNAGRYELENVALTVQDSFSLAFPDDAFDAALCVDALHHVFDLEGTLTEIARVVRPGGDVLIFEPNCLNPLLIALCLLDRNEWGAVARCWKGRYDRVLGRFFEPVRSEYNGLLIGPKGRLATGIADFLVEGPLAALLGRFGPEVFFHLRNRRAC
jgi:ubiquinone/menaquinone biosynthesis C-methylase UbiE